jgi:hypothetical protein
MSINDQREFRPELLSRRSEVTAWVFALVVGGSLAVMRQTLGMIPTVAWLFWGFLLFAGLSISLGNWMDRHTLIRIDTNGISFENGLRRVRLGWLEVQKVNVLPAHWGRTVQVLGEKSHFEFRTLGQVEFQGEARGRVGFVAGQDILEHILHTASLRLSDEANGGRYYCRS